MTQLPAISMSSIMSVELHFKQEAESYLLYPPSLCLSTQWFRTPKESWDTALLPSQCPII
jgi:hypothetical protein